MANKKLGISTIDISVKLKRTKGQTKKTRVHRGGEEAREKLRNNS